MNATRTAVHGDIIGSYKKAVYVKERMIRRHIFKVGTDKLGNDLIIRNSSDGHRLFQQRVGNDIYFVSRFRKNIFFGGINRNGSVSGESPRRCRPYHEKHPGKIAVSGKFAFIVFNGEFNVDGSTRIV